MVPYFGKCSLKQYIRGKPVKFGVKLWVLASSAGFPFDFDVYTGKDVEYKGLVGERVVMSFAEKFKTRDNAACRQTTFLLLRICYR